jgi:hypothetical protein
MVDICHLLAMVVIDLHQTAGGESPSRGGRPDPTPTVTR